MIKKNKKYKYFKYLNILVIFHINKKNLNDVEEEQKI